eukprot:COSAG01_NODE_3993_length_5456_cov_28.008774_2_plen_106_part_00
MPLQREARASALQTKQTRSACGGADTCPRSPASHELDTPPLRGALQRVSAAVWEDQGGCTCPDDGVPPLLPPGCVAAKGGGGGMFTRWITAAAHLNHAPADTRAG